MNCDMIEILIGRYVDGEIGPAEQQALDAELDRNPEARALVEQLEKLREDSRLALVSEIVDKAADAGVIFERAWRRSRPALSLRNLFANGRLRFAAGMAAGLLLAVLGQLAFSGGGRPVTKGLSGAGMVARDDTGEARTRPQQIQTLTSPQYPDVTRSVDYVNFTDESGNEWLVEGYRQSLARPASYNGNL